MKPVTGNKITEAIATQSILSIQLALDGLSFCVSRFGKPLWLHREPLSGELSVETCLNALWTMHEELRHAYTRIRIVADTDQACLIPEALYEEGSAGTFMRLGGIEPAEEAELRILRKEGYVLPMYVSGPAIKTIASLFPAASLEFIHPLWLGIRRAEQGSRLDIRQSASWVHIALGQEGKLLYAETLLCRNSADLLYILNQLSALFDPKTTELSFCGLHAESLRKQAASYYKKTSLDLPVPPKSVAPADVPLFANLIRAAYENY